MRAGRLRNRVTVQRPQEQTDDSGQLLDDFVDVASRWASVEPINGREFFEASGEHSDITTRIRLRYDPLLASIHTGWRVRHADQNYDVLYVINQDAANRELVLMCRGVAP